MITIKVQVNYDLKLKKAEEAILALPNRLKNLRPLMQQGVAPALNSMMRRHFESQGAAFGHPWAPLAESTIATRLSHGTLSKGILRDSDNLFRTIMKSRAADNRLRVVRGGLTLQANVGVRYALFHQVGTQFMPDRQVIPDPLPQTFRRTVMNLVREFIRSGKVNAR